MTKIIIHYCICFLCVLLVYYLGKKRGKNINEDDVKFIIDKYSELPIQYGPKLFNEILKQFNLRK